MSERWAAIAVRSNCSPGPALRPFVPHDLAARLASGERIEEPVAIVVAHPDDESLWLGTALKRLARATLIHLTDGAPTDMRDATRLGFRSRGDYAARRAGELDAALGTLAATPRRIAYDFADQSLAYGLPELIARLRADLAGMRAVLTHPYEGGHPDHDSAAFAVCRAFGGEIVEFACYHLAGGERAWGIFWPDADAPELVRALDRDEQALVGLAIDAHASQRAVTGCWRPAEERWRRAPRYDFAALPPPGAALYDSFGWAITSRGWRELAARC
ncbi:PIG-L deacetylase family protein [Sphingomonas horti]|nr:PIG-L family deacetylase [Sphingomonas horti]